MQCQDSCNLRGDQDYSDKVLRQSLPTDKTYIAQPLPQETHEWSKRLQIFAELRISWNLQGSRGTGLSNNANSVNIFTPQNFDTFPRLMLMLAFLHWPTLMHRMTLSSCNTFIHEEHFKKMKDLKFCLSLNTAERKLVKVKSWVFWCSMKVFYIVPNIYHTYIGF